MAMRLGAAQVNLSLFVSVAIEYACDLQSYSQIESQLDTEIPSFIDDVSSSQDA